MTHSTLALAGRATIDIIFTIANFFRDLILVSRRGQKLPPHFCEAGTAYSRYRKLNKAGMI